MRVSSHNGQQLTSSEAFLVLTTATALRWDSTCQSNSPIETRRAGVWSMRHACPGTTELTSASAAILSCALASASALALASASAFALASAQPSVINCRCVTSTRRPKQAPHLSQTRRTSDLPSARDPHHRRATGAEFTVSIEANFQFYTGGVLDNPSATHSSWHRRNRRALVRDQPYMSSAAAGSAA